MKVYELKKKKGSVSSIYAIALVENPAIEIGFVALSGNNIQVRLAVNEEKRMIYTPVLIPNQRILRKDNSGEPYQIYFSEETIEEAAQDFYTAKLLDKFNHEHIASKTLEGVSVVENWIIDDPKIDKSVKLGFDLPKGTWMQGIKIYNDAIWADVKAKKYKGISIEGLFENFESKLSKNQNKSTMKGNKKSIGQFLAMLGAILDSPVKLASKTLTDGKVIYTDADDFNVGASVFADEAMTEAIADGTYEIDENTLLVVEGGVVAEVRENAELSKEDGKNMEELAGYVAKIAERVQGLEKANQELKAENAELKKQTAEHAEKLSKVQGKATATSATKLSIPTEQLSKGQEAFRNLLNN